MAGSGKPHEAKDYVTDIMAGDAAALLKHLGIPRADVMGYSMGARITAFLALGRPDLVRSAILGGLGIRRSGVSACGWHRGRDGSAFACRRERSDGPDVPRLRRRQRAGSEGARRLHPRHAADVETRRTAAIQAPVLFCVGTKDDIAGDPHELAGHFRRQGRAVDIPGRDHNLAVGDKVYKQAVLAFLEERP